MEMIEILNRKIREQTGSTFFVTVGLLVIIITMYLAVTEYFRVINLYDSVTTEMERASNMAVEYSMIDEARGYHISVIDSDEAEKQFNTYFITRLEMTNAFEKIKDGKTCYKINFDTFEIDPDIPRMKMQGTVSINVELVGNYISTPINLPFDVKTRNVNMED